MKNINNIIYYLYYIYKMSDVFYLHRSNISKGLVPDTETVDFNSIFLSKSNEYLYKEHFNEITINKKLLKKFSNKKIGDTVPSDYDKLQLSSQSTYSSAFNTDAIITAKYIYNYYQMLINKFVKEEVVITDACANVGGNTIKFAQYFDKVNAVEFLSQEYNRLKNNIAQYSFNNVNIKLGDYFSHSANLEQDIIFFDPPWGGPDYKKYNLLGLSLTDNDITEDIENLLNNNAAKLIILKGPENTYIKNTKYLRSMVKFYKINERYEKSLLTNLKTTSLFNLYFFHIENSSEVEKYINSLESYTEDYNINSNEITIEFYNDVFNNIPSRVVNQYKIETDDYASPVNLVYNIDNSHYEAIIGYKTDVNDTVTDVQSNFKYQSKDIDRMFTFSIDNDSQVINTERLRQELFLNIINDIVLYFRTVISPDTELVKMINNYIFNKIVEKRPYDDAVIIASNSEIANSKIFDDLRYIEETKNIVISKRDKYNIVNFIQTSFSKTSEYLVTDKIISDGNIDFVDNHFIYSYSDANYLADEYEQKSLSIKIDDFMIEKLGDKIYNNPNKYIACYLRYKYLDLNTVALAFDYANEEITKEFNKDNTLECFASVFNFYYNNWCSAFPDIEDVFGSKGSFWNISNNEILKYKNIVVNPPFDKNIINLTLQKIDEVIIDSKIQQLENNIVVILPYWEDMSNIKRYKSNYNFKIIPKNQSKFIDYFGGKKIIQPSNIIVFII